MKTGFLTPSLLIASLIGLASPAASANDELVGALFGAGTGAIIGHSIGGDDGAVVGGFLGAAVGASIADNDDRRVIHHRPRPYVVYGPPVRYYAPPPYRHGPRYTHQHRHPHRDGWRDDYRDRRDDPWGYRNW